MGIYPSLMQRLLDNERDKAHEVYLRQPRHGVWQDYTWREVVHQARQVAAFLIKLGLKRGDHVSIFSKNCAEWFIADGRNRHPAPTSSGYRPVNSCDDIGMRI